MVPWLTPEATRSSVFAARIADLEALLRNALQKFQVLQQQLLEQLGGLTFFPQSNVGFWTMAGVPYRDAMVICGVLTSDEQEARRYLSALKERLKEELQQEEILLVERGVETRSLVF